MNYKNGVDVLPAELLKELQKYFQGELVYIPKDTNRASWGEFSGAKQQLLERNEEIFSLYNHGKEIKDLAVAYCLSEDSIKKIISRFKQNGKK